MNKLVVGCVTGLTHVDIPDFYSDVTMMCHSCPDLTLVCVDVFVEDKLLDQSGIPYVVIYVVSSSLENITGVANNHKAKVSLASEEDHKRFIPLATSMILGHSMDSTFVDLVGEVFLNRYPECRSGCQDKYAAICEAAAKARVKARELITEDIS